MPPHSVGLSRDVNRRKARRLKQSSLALAAALASIVSLTVSVAVHGASYPTTFETGSKLQCQAQKMRSPSKSTHRPRTMRPTWTIRCFPSPISTSSSARG